MLQKVMDKAGRQYEKRADSGRVLYNHRRQKIPAGYHAVCMERG